MTGPDPVAARPAGLLARSLSWLRRHPVVCLLLLTPGIPEYLSSSSSLTVLVANPVLFFLFLAANLGLYGPGALLIREARVRWGKGWATVVLLGAAYGILEEGIALSTMFNPTAGPVLGLGYYGHWMGVSWVWSAGIVMVHVLFSIAIPLLLLDLALPEFRGRSLLSRRGLGVASALQALDVTILSLVVAYGEKFWMGAPLLAASLLAIAALAVAARRVGPALLEPTSERPRWGPLGTGLFGVALYPAVLFAQALSESAGLPSAATVFLLLGLFGAFGTLFRARIGRRGNEAELISFAAGAVAPVAVFGFLAALPTPVVLIADVGWGLFLLRLYRRYAVKGRPTSAVGGPGRPAMGAAPDGA